MKRIKSFAKHAAKDLYTAVSIYLVAMIAGFGLTVGVLAALHFTSIIEVTI